MDPVQYPVLNGVLFRSVYREVEKSRGHLTAMNSGGLVRAAVMKVVAILKLLVPRRLFRYQASGIWNLWSSPLLGNYIQNGLLHIVGAIGKAGHPYLQRHIFRFSHVGVDV